MAKVKHRLLLQQSKIQNFEERQLRLENKKFHKALKAHKQNVKHSEKRQNMESIDKLKREIKSKGGDEPNEKEFTRLFNGGQAAGSKTQGKKGQKQRVFDQIQKSRKGGAPQGNREENRGGKNRNSKGIKKQQGGAAGGSGGKRPGKAQRSKHKQRNKKMRK